MSNVVISVLSALRLRPLALLNFNKGQSNLVIGGIAANLGFRPPNLPFSWRTWGPCLIQCYLRPHECPCQITKNILFPSNGFSRVHECDRRHTDGQMDSLRHGNIFRNRWNLFQRCCLKIDKVVMTPMIYGTELCTQKLTRPARLPV